MAGKADIRKLPQQKLGVERAQLYNRAGTIANSLSIKTSDAILVLAAKSHINLQKHGIASAKLEEIRKLLPHVSAATASVAAPVAASSNAKRGKAKSKKGFKVQMQDAEDDPILSKATHAEMLAMISVYQTLYTLENSIRQFINRVLTATHGKDWWDKLAPRGLKETVAKRTQEESVNAWHQKRSSNSIDYLDLDQLPALIRATQADFARTFFKTVEWFQHFVDEVYQSRRVVCHMNPLIQNNVDGVGLRFNHWENPVKEKIGEVLKLEEKVTATTVEGAQSKVVGMIRSKPSCTVVVPRVSGEIPVTHGLGLASPTGFEPVLPP